jgi:arylsulfatase A-like enzyme
MARISLAAYMMVFGLVLGGYTSLVEFGHAELTTGSIFSMDNIFPVIVFYMVIWGAAGLATGVLRSLISLLGRSAFDLAGEKALWTSFLFSFVALTIVGGYVNTRYLPGMLSRTSLAFDILLLALFSLLWLVVYRVGRRLMKTRREKAWLRSPLMAAAMALIAFLVFAAFMSNGRAKPRSSRQDAAGKDINVLLILADCLRPDHLGCYGYHRQTSPNIDMLAYQGIKFTNAYANGSRTKESTATLVTSLYPSEHSVKRISDALPEASTTLMELFQTSGYRTAIFSANPLISPLFGFDKGVDYLYGEPHSIIRSSLVAHIALMLSTRIDWLERAAVPIELVEMMFPPDEDQVTFRGGRSDVMNTAFLEWLDHDPDRNFFVYLHYMEPHTPYCPPKPYDELFDPDYQGERVCYPPQDPDPKLPFVEGTPVGNRELFNMVAQYDGSIAYLDTQVGNLIQELKDRGLADRTLIFLTADHGEGFYEHKGWGHGHSVYQNLLRVPVIAWSPNRVRSAQTYRMTFQTIDVMPTLLAAADIGIPDAIAIEGQNLWPNIAGGSDTGQSVPVFSEIFHADGYTARTLIRNGKKIIHTKWKGMGRVMLFDLNTDPNERVDLSENMVELRDEMLGDLGIAIEDASSKKRDSASRVLDEKLKARLRALGYID